MSIFEIADQWSIDNPYRDINEDMPYSNEVKYIEDKKWDDLTSKMDFLDGISEFEAKQFFAQINLYSYSQRSKNNYSKVPRPDKVIKPYIKRIDDLISDLDSPLFKDDIENLKALKKKLSNKSTLELYEFAYPQKPLTKKLIKQYLTQFIDKYQIPVTQKDKKDFIDFI